MLTMNNYPFYLPSEEEQSDAPNNDRKRDKVGRRQQRTQKENKLPAVIEEETAETTSNIITNPVKTKKKSGIKGFIRTCYRKVSPLQRKGYNKLTKDNN